MAPARVCHLGAAWHAGISLNDGIISHANALAEALDARAGQRCTALMAHLETLEGDLRATPIQP